MDQDREMMELEIEDKYREMTKAGEALDPAQYLKQYNLDPEQEEKLLKRLQKWQESNAEFEEYYESLDHNTSFRNILKEVNKRRRVIPMPEPDTKPEPLRWAALTESELEELTGSIGAVFTNNCPIDILGYSLMLYVEDENSISLEFEKDLELTGDLDGDIVKFSLKEAQLNYSEHIRDGQIMLDFGRLGATIEQYRDLVITICHKDKIFDLHLDEFKVIVRSN